MALVLSKSEIQRLLKKKPPLVEGYIKLEEQLQPNGVDLTLREVALPQSSGRITIQKGPDYFVEAANKVLKYFPKTKFVVAGSGDMFERMINRADELSILKNFIFTGFLKGADVHKAFQMADLYVMPSVSEPFGIAPLEALNHDVPVIISKQSGVSEVLTHALKVDFWDINEIANKIIAVLKYPPLQETLANHGNFEVRKLRWKDAAAKCINIYQETLVAV